MSLQRDDSSDDAIWADDTFASDLPESEQAQRLRSQYRIDAAMLRHLTIPPKPFRLILDGVQ